MSEPQQSVEVPVEVFNALFSASSTLASAAASLVTSEREGRIVLRATQPIIKRAVELMERDMHAANAAAREEGRLAGYADGLADGRPTPAPTEMGVLSHHPYCRCHRRRLFHFLRRRPTHRQNQSLRRLLLSHRHSGPSLRRGWNRRHELWILASSLHEQRRAASGHTKPAEPA